MWRLNLRYHETINFHDGDHELPESSHGQEANAAVKPFWEEMHILGNCALTLYEQLNIVFFYIFKNMS